MKNKALSLSTALGLLGLFLMIHAFASHASSEHQIVCQTAFGEKMFTIQDDRVAFQKEDESGASRSISSVSGESVMTHKKNNGFTKTLYIDSNKHQINIQDVDAFSDVNDYLSITSPKGHEMTYPLSCHSV